MSCSSWMKSPKTKFRRPTSHEPNRMQMRKILCSPSLAFDSAYVKYGVWTWPKSVRLGGIRFWERTITQVTRGFSRFTGTLTYVSCSARAPWNKVRSLVPFSIAKNRDLSWFLKLFYRDQRGNVLFYPRRGRTNQLEKQNSAKRGVPYLSWNLIDEMSFEIERQLEKKTKVSNERDLQVQLNR